MNKDDVRLLHMRDAANDAINFMRGQTREDITEDRKLALALTKAVEIVGEAAHHLSEQTKNEMPEIEWHKIIGMRNRLVHGYYEIDFNVLFQVVQKILPKFVASLEAHLNKNKQE